MPAEDAPLPVQAVVLPQPFPQRRPLAVDAHPDDPWPARVGADLALLVEEVDAVPRQIS